MKEAEATELTQWADRLIDRAVAEDTAMISVIDVRQATKLTPLFRQEFAKWESEMPAERFDRIGLRIVVVDNALIRGAITAIGWFSPRTKGFIAVKDCDQAVAALEKHARDTDAIPEVENAVLMLRRRMSQA